ncbi:MAG: FecR domain-containing protein [Prolixibacteraceae bacterium]|jgi:ferric-dicitrate binding protein FerR (iron transport regulator)|nr:FecR domain-containing protein [Prolixibacteraceae bacterium]
MDKESDFRKVVGLLYQKCPLDKNELADIGEFLRNPSNLHELNSYLHKIPESSPSDIKLKIESVWAEIEKRTEPESFFSRIIPIVRKYAAILLLPLFIYTIWVSYQHFLLPEEYFTLATSRGEQTNVILPDGSSAWLNVDTRITYSTSYGKKERELTVCGEAYFKVKKNAAIPFIVHIRNMDVRALGTAFNVRGYEDDAIVQTSLVEGKVGVKINTAKVGSEQRVLSPGQTLAYNKTTDSAQMRMSDNETVKAWTDKQLIFENTPFDEVIKNTERWFNVKITYEPARFKNDYLTLRLKKGESLERLFEIIDETIGINYKVDARNIILTPKK